MSRPSKSGEAATERLDRHREAALGSVAQSHRRTDERGRALPGLRAVRILAARRCSAGNFIRAVAGRFAATRGIDRFRFRLWNLRSRYLLAVRQHQRIR
jgi:hypothetical protein